MNSIKRSELPAILAALAGGFYMGIVQKDGQHMAIIKAPKAQGETKGVWGPYDEIAAASCVDGAANTKAMAEADSDLAKWALGLNIDGLTDWHLPARDVLELCYRNAKPGTRMNLCSFRDGDNPSSIPPGYPYTDQSPAPTENPLFKEGGDEAFETDYYWSSTQYSADNAYYRRFRDGSTGWSGKGRKLRAFVVRLLPILD